MNVNMPFDQNLNGKKWFLVCVCGVWSLVYTCCGSCIFIEVWFDWINKTPCFCVSLVVAEYKNLKSILPPIGKGEYLICLFVCLFFAGCAVVWRVSEGHQTGQEPTVVQSISRTGWGSSSLEALMKDHCIYNKYFDIKCKCPVIYITIYDDIVVCIWVE